MPIVHQAPNNAASTQRQQPQWVPCQRKQPVKGNTDWVTLLNYPSHFIICPGCYNAHILPTGYGQFFTQPGTWPQEAAIRCDFSGSWVRMGWSQLLSRNSTDLTLLMSLARISTTDGECPNRDNVTESVEAMRSWRTTIDPATEALMTDFTICGFCSANIETLFPALRGMFVDASPVPCMGICDMGAPTKRSGIYLSLLMGVADGVQSTGYRRLEPLLGYIREFGPLANCQRNKRATGKYYVMSKIEELTVCEECYQEVIVPLRNGPICLAAYFVEPAARQQFFTCQLYSPRMRNMFQQANERNDMDQLRQAVVQRRAKEAELLPAIEALQAQWAQTKKEAGYYRQMGEMQMLSSASAAFSANLGGFSAMVIFPLLLAY